MTTILSYHCWICSPSVRAASRLSPCVPIPGTPRVQGWSLERRLTYEHTTHGSGTYEHTTHGSGFLRSNQQIPTHNTKLQASLLVKVVSCKVTCVWTHCHLLAGWSPRRPSVITKGKCDSPNCDTCPPTPHPTPPLTGRPTPR